MPDNLLAEVCAPANIAAAWVRFATRHGIWAPGQALRHVAGAPVGPMLELVDELRTGRYRPRAPCLVPVAKGDGTFRTLAIFPVRDRVAQRAVLQVVQRITERHFLPASCGFRPGRGVALALNQARRWIAAGFGWTVDADILNCFGSLEHDLLLDGVAAILPDRSLVPLIATMVESGSSATASGSQTGIAQGSCLSPWLCNVYLHALDADMDAHRIPLVRYADDLLVFSFSRAAAENSLDLLRRTLKRLRLTLHPLKSRIAWFDDGVRFLGALLDAPRLLPQSFPER